MDSTATRTYASPAAIAAVVGCIAVLPYLGSLDAQLTLDDQVCGNTLCQQQHVSTDSRF